MNIRLSSTITNLTKIKKDLKEIEDQLRVDLPADIFDQILKVDKKTLKMNGYPDWAIRRKKEKVKEKTQDEEEEPLNRVFIPYIKHCSEKIARELWNV